MKSNIIDFVEFKRHKECDNQLEDNYIKFLTHVNQFIGIPNNAEKAFGAIYYILRYLEGTITALSVLNILKIATPSNTLEEGKQKVIHWLKDIIKEIENL